MFHQDGGWPHQGHLDRLAFRSMTGDECRHLWLLAGEPPTDEPELRQFVCDFCPATMTEWCDVDRCDPYTLDPCREAVGGVIQDVYGLEIWLRELAADVLQLSGQDRDASRMRVANAQPSDHINIIRKHAPSTLFPEHVERLTPLLDEADEVLVARHHLVHGIWIPNQYGTAMWAKKTGRRGKPWSQQRFDRRSLLQMHRAVSRLSGQCQDVANKLLNDRRYRWYDDGS